MELIIGAAAVLGLMFLLGVEIGTIAAVVQIVLNAFTFLTLLFFLFCVFVLLCSKKYGAEFAGLEARQKEKPDENKNDQAEKKDGMKFAQYIVDGNKLSNWFPAEAIMTGRIYSQGQCTVRISRLGSKQFVFDRHSVVIVVAGTVLMGLCNAGFLVYWLLMLKA